jgi:HNH endonuclease
VSPALEKAIREPLADRFWAKVAKGDNCWLWLASADRTGAGQFRVGNRMLKAHRVAWELVQGAEPPAGMLRHACGNLRCVRPDHCAVAGHRGEPANLAIGTAARFSRFVRRDESCWFWTGSKDRGGYGQFSLGNTPSGRMPASTTLEGRNARAHRVAWEFAFGPIPKQSDVVHSCRNRECVNPSHLRLDTDGSAKA